MRRKDIKEVSKIEKLSFPSPWTKQMFEQELKKNLSYFYIVRHGGKVIAYAGFWLLFDEAHIVNFCVHPSYRRKQIGSNLLRHILCEAKSRGARIATLEVRTSNKGAQAFYEKMGFLKVGKRAFYYSDTGEDAILMSRQLW